MTNPKLASVKAGIGFIGTGAVGSNLALAFYKKGHAISGLTSRSLVSALALQSLIPGSTVYESYQDVVDVSSLVFLTVPDDAIENVTESINWSNHPGVVHCSGVRSLDALTAARAQGAMIGTFHPLFTFVSRKIEHSTELPSFGWAIEGDPALSKELDGLAVSLGGWPLHLSSEDRILYHASAVMACGLLVALLDQTTELWKHFQGANSNWKADSLRSILPLAQTTLANVAEKGLSNSFTGPLSRGDVSTVERHLESLSKQSPDSVNLYCQLTLASLPLAMERGNLTIEDQKFIEGLVGKYSILQNNR